MARRRGINSSARGSTRKGSRNFWWLFIAGVVFVSVNAVHNHMGATPARPAPAPTAHHAAPHTVHPKPHPKVKR